MAIHQQDLEWKHRYLNISIVKAAVFAAISILKERGILRDEDPPDGVYEGVIEKFGYSEGISLHEGC